jgi:hypothetical protein
LSLSTEEQDMKDMEQHLLKLRTDAEECSNISKLATDSQKQELFARLAQHLNVLASEVARAIAAKSAGDA